MDYSQLSEKVKHHAVDFFKSHDDAKHIYHNHVHTEAVVAGAKKIAAHYELNEKDFFIVTAASWFHDAGYFNGDPENHARARGYWNVSSGFFKRKRY